MRFPQDYAQMGTMGMVTSTMVKWSTSAGNKGVQGIKTFSVKLANDTNKKSVTRAKEVARVTKRFVPCFVSVIASRARAFACVTV